MTSDDHENLIARGKQFVDSARPCANSVSAENLLYLAKSLKKPEYREQAEQIVQAARDVLRRSPSAAPRLVTAIEQLIEN